jgi:acetylornithine deacetylase/succinyl-diaminopimelate desuccinylase-like protein
VAVTVAALEELVAIPSVSSDPARRDDVSRAAAWLAKRLDGLNGRVVPTGGHPLVLAEWLGAEGAPTILVYAHYDVQPAGEAGAWLTPPFEPAVRGERLYGRGTSDDKGPMLAALGAIERILEERGRLPVNVRVLLEGEEEIGSPNLEAALLANREALHADVAVSADGAMWSAEQPSLNVAARGMVAVEVCVRGPSADLHSGRHGGTVQNPLRALAEILASLHRADGSIAVDGFMDGVVDLTAADRDEIAQMPFDEGVYRDELGVPELHGESGYSPLERLTARPTLEVSQIEGGGRYTVIPAVARAYLTCRLVPDQDPARVAAAIARHVLHRCPEGAIASVEELPGSIPAYAMRRDHPALAAGEQALRAVYPGRQVLRTRAGGTLPAAVLLRRALGLDTLLFSFSSSDEGFHGPNEFFRLSRFHEGTDAWARLLDLLARRHP